MIANSALYRKNIENGIVSYMLMLALNNLNKQMPDAVGKEWIEVLTVDLAKVFEGLLEAEQTVAMMHIHNFSMKALDMNCNDTDHELVLSVCMLINKLANEKRFTELTSQGVLVSGAILMEQREEKIWGSTVLARVTADRMYDYYLKKTSYFNLQSTGLILQ